jgi:hypothetical protein
MGLKFNPFTGKLDFTGSAGGGSPTGAAGGDLAGTYPNPTVDGLQGRPVSNATPVNGQVLQYDGANWVPGSIPSGGSGGGGVVYYLNFNTAADAPVTNIPQTPNTTKELGIIAEAVTTSYTSPILSTASYNFLASFVTDLNVPAATAIPAGLWDFNIWAESTTTNTSNHILYKIEVLKYDGVNAPVLLATSADNYIYDPQDITQYVTSIALPQTTILATDRIVVYLYGKATQNNNTITFHFGGQYPSHTHSTMPSVTGTGVVKVVNGVFQSPASTIVNADVSASAAIEVSKLSQATSRILGRTTAGTGAVEEITVGTGLSLSAGTLSSTVTAGATNIFIPASAWIPRTTTGCGVDSRELATNRTNYDELLFDAGTDEFAQALNILPNNYNNGTITARFYWTASTGSGNVVWGIQGRAYANDDSLDTAFGTAQTVTDTLIATDDMHITSATSAVTIGGTPAANTPILFQIYRDADAGGDTLSSDARLLGVEISFN